MTPQFFYPWCKKEMSQPCPFCTLISELPASGEMLQTFIITKREKYQHLEVNVGNWMMLNRNSAYLTPHKMSDKADEAISVLVEKTFPPTKREDGYAITCPHAPGGTKVKYMYAVVGDKTAHLIGKNEFLMRMRLEKSSPPSVDGANATGTQ